MPLDCKGEKEVQYLEIIREEGGFLRMGKKKSNPKPFEGKRGGEKIGGSCALKAGGEGRKRFRAWGKERNQPIAGEEKGGRRGGE